MQQNTIDKIYPLQYRFGAICDTNVFNIASMNREAGTTPLSPSERDELAVLFIDLFNQSVKQSKSVGQFRDLMVKFNGSETPLRVLLDDNDGRIENQTLIKILSLQVGEKCYVNNGAAGIDEFERVEDLDNSEPSEPVTPNYIFTKMKEIKERVAKNKTARISVCDAPNWDVEEYSLMPTIAEKLRSEGYVVSTKINHGVTDYTIVFSGSKSA